MELYKKIFISSIMLVTLLISGCKHDSNIVGTIQSRSPVSKRLITKMYDEDMEVKAPVLIRIFKKEGQLEIWKQTHIGNYKLLSTYNICARSGKLGPKFIEFDRQAPEGIYKINANSLNAYSHHYLAINIGFPNVYDQEHGRSGGSLMIHGGCSSSGCYSMTDKNIKEIYALVRDAILAGQTEVQVQAFPFRMTASNMAIYRNDPNFPFWNELKKGYDYFNVTNIPITYNISNGHYMFPQVPNREYAKNFNKYATKSDEYKLNIPYRNQGIKGIGEAKRIANWMKKRIKGEDVGETPPR